MACNPRGQIIILGWNILIILIIMYNMIDIIRSHLNALERQSLYFPPFESKTHIKKNKRNKMVQVIFVPTQSTVAHTNDDQSLSLFIRQRKQKMGKIFAQTLMTVHLHLSTNTHTHTSTLAPHIKRSNRCR